MQKIFYLIIIKTCKNRASFLDIDKIQKCPITFVIKSTDKKDEEMFFNRIFYPNQYR